MRFHNLCQVATFIAFASPAIAIPFLGTVFGKRALKTTEYVAAEGGSFGGDGYYLVAPPVNGVSLVHFTALEDISSTVTDPAIESRSPNDALIMPRQETPYPVHCGIHDDGVKDVLNCRDLELAQSELSQAIFVDIVWPAGHWAFVRVGDVMAYACAYRDTAIAYRASVFYQYSGYLDVVCGWPNVGWVGNLIADVNVGRTWYGNSYCVDTGKVPPFIGW